MAKANAKDLSGMTLSDLNKELGKISVDLYELGISLRSNQSNEVKKYHTLKKRRAQIKTELNNRPEPTNK